MAWSRCRAYGARSTGCACSSSGARSRRAYATKLLCELGADVCKVEPPGGDPLRTWTPVASAAPTPRGGGLFRYLNGGKRSAVVDLATTDGARGSKRQRRGADLVVESLGAGGLERLGLGTTAARRGTARRGRAHLRLRPDGAATRASRRAGFTVQALGGWVSSHGVPEPAPGPGRRAHPRVHRRHVRGSRRAERVARARAGARDVVVDLSVMECLVGTLPYPTPRAGGHAVGGPAAAAGALVPAARDPSLPRRVGRHQRAHRAALRRRVRDARGRGVRRRASRRSLPAARCSTSSSRAIQPWLDARDAEEVVELSQAFRVPARAGRRRRMMLEYAQFAARPFFVEEDGVTMPGPPYRLSATPAARAGRRARSAETLGAPVEHEAPRADRAESRPDAAVRRACVSSTWGRSGPARTARCTSARSAPT